MKFFIAVLGMVLAIGTVFYGMLMLMSYMILQGAPCIVIGSTGCI